MHAYQPRRIVDAFTGEERVFGKPITKRVRDREVKGKNYFDIILVPGSVYDEIVKASEMRSINVEPITLIALKQLNEAAFNQLMELVLSRKTFILATSYSHPILPMMMENSELDAKINFYWSLMFYYETFWRPLWEREKRVPLIGFWFPECAYSKDALTFFFEVLNKLATSWGWTNTPQVYLIFDELHGIDLDPSRMYMIKAGERQCSAFFRYHSLSYTVAFENKLRKIMSRFWKETKRCKYDLIGVANDAECYGGNYNPDKPVMFEKMRKIIEKRGWISSSSKGERRSIQIVPAAQHLENFKDSVPEAKLKDYAAWSDYEDIGHPFRLRGRHPALFEYYIGYAAGGLCRWTGLERNSDGTLSNRTYFLMVSWFNPLDKKTYVRIVSSLWKVAFNRIRDQAANFVRLDLLNIIQQYVKQKDDIEEILIQYWVCALQKERVESFMERMVQKGLLRPLSQKEDSEALAMALRAYQWACQDAYISCPTFYSDIFFESETTWTSLAYSAAALAKIANAFYSLKQMDEVEKVAEKYRTLFFDFYADPFWGKFVEGLEVPFKLLLEEIKEAAKKNGYDLSKILRSADLTKMSEEELWSWALRASRELYEAALHGWIPLMPQEENPHLVLAEAYRALGQREKAEEQMGQAKWHEWRKCIRPVHTDKNIVQRVGLLHAKHFPEYKQIFGISEEDTRADVRPTETLRWEL